MRSSTRYEQLVVAVVNHSAQLLLKAMSGHYVCTNNAVLGRWAKCAEMSDV